MAAIRLSDRGARSRPTFIRSALDARAALHGLTERLVMVVAGVTVILLGIWSRSWGRSERLLPPLKARVAADIRCCVRPMTEVRDRPLAVLVGLVAAAVWFLSVTVLIPVRVTFGAGSVRCGTVLHPKTRSETGDVCPRSYRQAPRRSLGDRADFRRRHRFLGPQRGLP